MKYLAFALLLCLTTLTSSARTDTTTIGAMRPYAIYDIACADSLRYNLPLVVGINVLPPASYWCSCQVASLPGFPSGVVEVFLPKDGALLTAATLPATASATDIQAAVSRGLPTTNEVSYRGGTPATLNLTVPADATVAIDGKATTATGTQRCFQTPPLATGSTYFYCIKIACCDGWTCEKKVTFAAGDTVTLACPCCTMGQRAPGCNCGPGCQCPNCPGNGCVNSNSTPGYKITPPIYQPLSGFGLNGFGNCANGQCGVPSSFQQFQPMMQPMFFGGGFGGGSCAGGRCR